MGTGFAKKKKQARLLQEQFGKMQEQMKSTTVTGTSPGELITVKLNGEHELLEVKIKPECVDPEDIEGLEDLFKKAYNDALAKLQKDSMPMSLPGLPDLSSFGF